MKAPFFSVYAKNSAEVTDTLAELSSNAVHDEQRRHEEYDPNRCPHCWGAGVSHEQPDGCSGCKGTGQRRKGYWNNYGRDWDDSED